MQIKKCVVMVALLMSTASVQCASKLDAFKAAVISIADSPLGQDVGWGIANGVVARMLARSLYGNVAGISQNTALLTGVGSLALGIFARAWGKTSNIPLNALVGIGAAAATLNWWPIVEKSERAELIGDKDAGRNLKNTITQKAGERAANSVAHEAGRQLVQNGTAQRLADNIARNV